MNRRKEQKSYGSKLNFLNKLDRDKHLHSIYCIGKEIYTPEILEAKNKSWTSLYRKYLKETLDSIK